MSKGIDNFYYDLLNIGKKEEDKTLVIEKIISKCTKESEYEKDSLCRVYANNIAHDLASAGIDYRVLSTKDLGSDYEHIFLVAFYKTEQINYVLIDPTFSQFVKQADKSLVAFEVWPSEIISKSSEGNMMVSQLDSKGYCMVDEKSFLVYLNAFGATLKLGDILTLENHDINSYISKL